MTRVYYNGNIWTGNTEVPCMLALGPLEAPAVPV